MPVKVAFVDYETTEGQQSYLPLEIEELIYQARELLCFRRPAFIIRVCFIVSFSLVLEVF